MRLRRTTTILLISFVFCPSALEANECHKLIRLYNGHETWPKALTEDFEYRDSLPETELSPDRWLACGPFGPCPYTYPRVHPPKGVSKLKWLRERAVKVAERYLQLPYEHKHIPSAGGLDCSNYSAWIYNWGFGIRFSSNVGRQSETAGRRLDFHENLEAGDLLFYWHPEYSRIWHVSVFMGEGRMIHSVMSEGVQAGEFDPEHPRFAWARRILE